jgi:MEMO1 family protein
MIHTMELLLLLAGLLAAPLMAQNVRPVRDSVGFCWNAGEMDALIRYLDEHAGQTKPLAGNMVAAVSVHDDYLYAGRVYYPLYKILRAKEVVIFGVTHSTVTKEIGPLSNVLDN